MNKFTKEMIDTYADKILINLTDEENKMILEEMNILDESMEKISKINGIQDVEPMTHSLSICDYELWDDDYEESIEINDALNNSKDHLDREIVVPKVVG